MPDCSRGWCEDSLFNSYYTKVMGRAPLFFLGLLHFTFDLYLIMLSTKQGDIKYNFLSLWYNLIWDWTPVSWTTGEHSNHYANGPVLPAVSLISTFGLNSLQDLYSITIWLALPNCSCSNISSPPSVFF